MPEQPVPRSTPDRITVRGITAHAHHGVYDWERERGQTFAVDVVLELDTAPAAAGDDLEKTVNYAELSQGLHAILVGEPVDLLETLAQRLADACLANPLVDAVEITVHKPDAELGVPFDDVTVAIRRTKDPLLPTTRELAAGPGSGPRSETGRDLP